ncbi:cytochrome c oxidase subunit 3 [Mycobacterium sp. 1274756.6]|uniref:cytochrome c oxidase subunit 3 n=1 Tax=Mycobacterium sp. 1274756.6 TaxID=1834076 RepID=UPI0018D4A387|nr:cytochrome c oxidase subunit 3 [Mycobacterium sp. 1274756.6]
MWLFIFGDLCVFSIMFVAFLVMRGRHHAMFVEAEHHLDIAYGAVMTLLLLASSLFVVRGVQAQRLSNRTTAPFVMAIACGIAFVALKAVEWGSHLRAGQTLVTNHFWNFYYVLTGVHLVHILVGLVFLTYMSLVVRDPAKVPRHLPYIEGAACFWHMVDLLWIMIFPLLYLLR